MTPRILLLALPLALGPMLAGCDGDDSRVAALSEELSATQTELDRAMEENARLQEELEQARMQGGAPSATTGGATAGGSADGGATLQGGASGGATTGAGPADATTGGGAGDVEPVLTQAIRGELQAMAERLSSTLAELEQIDAGNEDVELAEARQSLVEAVRSAETLMLVVGGPAGEEGGASAPDTPAEAPAQAPPPEIMEEAPAQQ